MYLLHKYTGNSLFKNIDQMNHQVISAIKVNLILFFVCCLFSHNTIAGIGETNDN